MELKIIGSEVELAGFLKALGTSTIQMPSMNIVPSVKTEPVKTLELDNKEYVPIKVAIEKFNVCRQTLINYSNIGMPHKRLDNGKKDFVFCLEDIEPWINSYRKRHPRKKSVKKPVAKTPFSKWKAELTSMCREAGKDEGKMLSLTYKYMTKRYGIVWEQSKKDFFKAKGYSPSSTCQIAYWLEDNNKALTGLTKGCLATVLKEN